MVLRPARRLLIFASVVTLALNVAELLVASEYGEACAWLAAGAIPGGRVLRAADNMADAAKTADKPHAPVGPTVFIPGTKASLADGTTKPIEGGASCRVAVRPRTAWRERGSCSRCWPAMPRPWRGGPMIDGDAAVRVRRDDGRTGGCPGRRCGRRPRPCG